jgi:hypothetical protein
MKDIYELLGITQEKYNEILFQKYFDWCGAKAQSQVHLQQLLANKKMYKWFMVQITGLEVDFRDEATPYVELNDSAAMIKLWHKSTMKIFMYYSVPLLNVARKVNITNTIQAHDIRSN